MSAARLSFVFVTDQAIRKLNREFLGRDRPTDVLAFDLADGPHRRDRPVEGEVVISAMAARRQAKQYGASPSDELLLYVIHGLLHLLGYDDRRPAEAKRMRKRERELLRDAVRVK